MSSLRRRPEGAAWSIVVLAIASMSLLLVMPLVVVFARAFDQGLGAYLEAITDTGTLAAVRLTLLVVAIVVPIQAVCGVAVAWALARGDFPGKTLLSTVVDLPFAISPVVSGLLFVLLFGARGIFGEVLRDHDVRILYAVPGVVLATLFVTLPFVAREIVPLLESDGLDEEEAAASLGASGWQTLWRITLPRIRWALFYGMVLAAARAAGEFGAVNVVSGNVRGDTETLPLHVEALYHEYAMSAAFASASLLAITGLVTLGGKAYLEHRVREARARASHLRLDGASA
ncbi:MAG: sulfate ABC transporter permease subunit CysW [Sandaracinus sp.]